MRAWSESPDPRISPGHPCFQELTCPADTVRVGMEGRELSRGNWLILAG